MKCPGCGKENPAGEQYCLDCGAELAARAGAAAPASTPASAGSPAGAAATPSAMTDEEFQQLLQAPPAAQKCPHCGAAAPAGGTFCDSCGEPLTAEAASATAAAAAGAAGAGSASTNAGAHPSVASGPVVQDASVMPVAGAPADQAVQVASAPDKTSSAVSTPGAASGVTFEIGGPTSTSVYTLTTDDVQVGRRDPDAGIFPEIDFEGNDIVVDGGERVHAVSRRHGRIFRDSDGLKYEDLGSTNGSTLNGAAVLAHDPQSLKDGDKIVLGRTCRIAVHVV